MDTAAGGFGALTHTRNQPKESERCGLSQQKRVDLHNLALRGVTFLCLATAGLPAPSEGELGSFFEALEAEEFVSFRLSFPPSELKEIGGI